MSTSVLIYHIVNGLFYKNYTYDSVINATRIRRYTNMLFYCDICNGWDTFF